MTEKEGHIRTKLVTLRMKGTYSTGVVCAQKNHRGVDALLTVIDHWGREGAPEATGMKPESTPKEGVVIRSHGLAKVDWVTD